MTDKLREAAQQALETLEKFVSNELTFGQRYTNEGEQMLASIYKLRAALAEYEPIKLEDIEQYRLQMAGISTAAIGYWKEGDSIHPDYDTLALRDVAKLYAKYHELYCAEKEQPAEQEPVAWVWNPARESWERVRVFGYWQRGAIYAFGPEAPQPAKPKADRQPPTHREVMQQALEVLEDLQDAACKTNDKKLARYIQVIATLRTALAEQPAEPEQEPVAWMCSNTELMHKGYQRFSATSGGDWNIPVYTAPQPAKHPFLVRDLAELIGSTAPDVCNALEDMGIEPRRSTNAAVTPDEALAVARRLAPPAKQPLTTQEIDAVMRKALGYGLSPGRDDLDFARAIEAAHGINVPQAQGEQE